MSNITMISTFDSKNISFICPEVNNEKDIEYKSFDVKFDEKIDCFQFKTVYSSEEKIFKTNPIVRWEKKKKKLTLLRQEKQGYIK